MVVRMMVYYNTEFREYFMEIIESLQSGKIIETLIVVQYDN